MSTRKTYYHHTHRAQRLGFIAAASGNLRKSRVFHRIAARHELKTTLIAKSCGNNNFSQMISLRSVASLAHLGQSQALYAYAVKKMRNHATLCGVDFNNPILKTR